MDDYAHEQVMTHPSDGFPCLVCGESVMYFPEGIFHVESR